VRAHEGLLDDDDDDYSTTTMRERRLTTNDDDDVRYVDDQCWICLDGDTAGREVRRRRRRRRRTINTPPPPPPTMRAKKKTRGAEISLCGTPRGCARAWVCARDVTRPLRTHRLTYYYTCAFSSRSCIIRVRARVGRTPSAWRVGNYSARASPRR